MPTSSPRLERYATLVMAAAAIAGAALTVRREFFGPMSVPQAEGEAPVFFENWRDFEANAVSLGSPQAAVHIIEFADLECPFCARIQPSIDKALSRFGNDVVLNCVHFPISSHRFAMPAAKAAECAHEVGSFAEFVSAVYAKQDSLGLKSWGSYADDTGIRDTLAIANCALNPTSVARIDSGLALGQRIGLRGTPTLFVNGWRLRGAVPESVLIGTIDRILAGKTPGK